jgi:hypothetical protein
LYFSLQSTPLLKTRLSLQKEEQVPNSTFEKTSILHIAELYNDKRKTKSRSTFTQQKRKDVNHIQQVMLRLPRLFCLFGDNLEVVAVVIKKKKLQFNQS